MHFQFEILEDRRKYIFRENETKNKVQVMFVDVKVVAERYQYYYWTFSTNKEATVYVFSV